MTGGEDKSARFNTIETNVGALKSEVTGIKGEVESINDELDKLIENFGNLNTAPPKPVPSNLWNDAASEKHQPDAVVGDDATVHTEHADGATGGHVGGKAPADMISPVATSRRDSIPEGYCNDMREEMQRYIRREMQRDRFEYTHNGNVGHVGDIHSGHGMAKPYMYVVKEGISTRKQKLDIRHQLTVLEYVDATLALLADKKAYRARNTEDIMHHLKNVTRDALERPWPAVRRWTQHMWDCVENGTIKWGNRDTIQQERVRIFLTGGGIMLNAGASNTQKRGQYGTQEVVCRAFNTRQGCMHRDSHQDGPVFALHICSYCDHIGRSCSHSIKECERKITHARAYQDNGNQGYAQGGYQTYNRPQNQAHNGYNTQNQNHANYNTQHLSKNVAAAPHW